ncbi:MAG: LysR family transcriptional regulator [Pseudomonadota bacterium]|nr:LysR family transcriptional regulator [Pseudomonadota bacterium]
MNHLDSIRIFSKVAQCLNFADAGRQLGLSSAVVTRGVATLERHLNARLINRTTRRVSLTAAGIDYFEGCQDVPRLLDAMELPVFAASNRAVGALKIAASVEFAESGLTEVLSPFHLQQPQITFDVTVFETACDIAPDDFDVCFVAERRLRDSTLICRQLAKFKDVFVAAPAYLARRGTPGSPFALNDHDIISTLGKAGKYWEFQDSNGLHRVLVQPLLATGNVLTSKRAAREGLGVARLPASLVARELADGTLLRVLESYPAENDERALWMLYSGQEYVSRALRVFIDFVVKEVRAEEGAVSAS